jgi:hypothetical protein
MNNKTKRIVAVLLIAGLGITLNVKSDDVDNLVQTVKNKKDQVNDLISTILTVSPTERAKAAKFRTSGKGKSKASGVAQSSVPNLGIPDNQLLNVDEKFPKDYVGKYVYGRVSFKSISQEGNDVAIHFTAKGYRGFVFYTKDPYIINAFSQFGWGTKFDIPKECPLRILTKDFTFYVVRLPFDQDTTEHSMRELIQQGGRDMKSIIQDTMNRVNNDLNGIPNQ